VNKYFIYFWFSRIFLLGILIFKGITARRLHKSFGVNGLIMPVRRTAKAHLEFKKRRCLNNSLFMKIIVILARKILGLVSYLDKFSLVCFLPLFLFLFLFFYFFYFWTCAIGTLTHGSCLSSLLL
jgi:hypothetical protein